MVKKIIKNQKGQLMVECLVALSILTVGFLAMVTLLTHSLASNYDVLNRLIAANLAEEGIEVVKNIIDTNVAARATDPTITWNAGITNGTSSVVYDSNSLGSDDNSYLKLDTNGFYNYSSGNNTIFKRKIEIFNLNINEVKVKSTVTWTAKNRSNSISVEDHFFNWRN